MPRLRAVRRPLPDALQQLHDALAAAAALSPAAPPSTASPPAAPPPRPAVPPPLVAQADVALATPALATPQLAHERTCVVCWDAPREVRFAPCGHAVCCRRCAAEACCAAPPASGRGEGGCPICKGRIASWVEEGVQQQSTW
eukprot:scaffold42457_cov68-Phaeocystis_antarctica.AAC.10